VDLKPHKGFTQVLLGAVAPMADFGIEATRSSPRLEDGPVARHVSRMDDAEFELDVHRFSSCGVHQLDGDGLPVVQFLADDKIHIVDPGKEPIKLEASTIWRSPLHHGCCILKTPC
jgi:hypothetical protein